MLPYQVMPDLSQEEYNELKADIAARGVQVAIELDEEGNVLDGHHRVKACAELGITEYPTVIRMGLTESEKLIHARALNIARRHLTAAQKGALVQAQLHETPERSNRQIARDLGVDHTTVSNHRKKLERRGEIRRAESITDTLGRQQPRKETIKPGSEPPEPPTPAPSPIPAKRRSFDEEYGDIIADMRGDNGRVIEIDPVEEIVSYIGECTDTLMSLADMHQLGLEHAGDPNIRRVVTATDTFVRQVTAIIMKMGGTYP